MKKMKNLRGLTFPEKRWWNTLHNGNHPEDKNLHRFPKQPSRSSKAWTLNFTGFILLHMYKLRIETIPHKKTSIHTSKDFDGIIRTNRMKLGQFVMILEYQKMYFLLQNINETTDKSIKF